MISYSYEAYNISMYEDENKDTFLNTYSWPHSYEVHLMLPMLAKIVTPKHKYRALLNPFNGGRER